MRPDGCITGSGTAVGTFSFTARVADQSSPPQVVTKALSIDTFAQDQGTGGDSNQAPLNFGGVGGVKIAERVIAGVTGNVAGFIVGYAVVSRGHERDR